MNPDNLENDPFSKMIWEKVKDIEPQQYPIIDRDFDGDYIDFLYCDDDKYSVRVDRFLSVYYSEETGELIGTHLKNVSELFALICKQNPGFVINVEDGRVKLVHVLSIKTWMGNLSGLPERTYKNALKIAQERGIDLEVNDGEFQSC